uniref:Uncharacterized protein n=1 Tax=Kalanchoe fedtschenkoi TaxID=63787 RepID=A0A7N0V4K1_KALFE
MTQGARLRLFDRRACEFFDCENGDRYRSTVAASTALFQVLPRSWKKYSEFWIWLESFEIYPRVLWPMCFHSPPHRDSFPSEVNPVHSHIMYCTYILCSFNLDSIIDTEYDL